MKGLKKMKLEPIMYVTAGAIVGELGMKFVPFGGKYNPLLIGAVGALAMQGKGDMMAYGGAGILGNCMARFAGNMIPQIKAVSGDTIDTVYEEIVSGRKNISGPGKDVVLLGTDEYGNEVYGDPAEAENYVNGFAGGGGQTLMGGLESQDY